jgi:hypothetical protein
LKHIFATFASFCSNRRDVPPWAKAVTGAPADEPPEEFVHEHPRQAVTFVRQHPAEIEQITPPRR